MIILGPLLGIVALVAILRSPAWALRLHNWRVRRRADRRGGFIS